MRIEKVVASNFGSFSRLELFFDEQGLILINGPTGSGKSTLCDLIPWALFGVTAKNGNADEVLRWQSDKPTKVTVWIDGREVTRIRGPKGRGNDLFLQGGPFIRGKDIPDTQRLINELLGMNAETYLAGAYYTEFSPTAQFFQTTPKNRRTLCEQIVDLSFAKTLQEETKERLSEIDENLKAADTQSVVHRARAKFLEVQIENAHISLKEWEKEKDKQIDKLISLTENFDKSKSERVERLEVEIALNKEKLAKLARLRKTTEHLEQAITESQAHRCKECGGPLPNEKTYTLVSRLEEVNGQLSEGSLFQHHIRNAERQLTELQQTENNYADLLEKKLAENNPFDKSIKSAMAAKDKAEKDAAAFLEAAALLKSEIDDLEKLKTTVASFRAQLVKNTVVGLESKTNALLSDFFDAEIKVSFEVQDADKLDVIINKDGNRCVYTQLSKGQRQLLKLCFGIAAMEQISNHHGIDFNAVFFDEATDGLDETSKSKAYQLLSSLQTRYHSVYLVDHSESLKSLAPIQIVVSLIDGESLIAKA